MNHKAKKLSGTRRQAAKPEVTGDENAAQVDLHAAAIMPVSQRLGKVELPKLELVSEIAKHPPVLPRPVVDGLFREGELVLFGSQSKNSKSLIAMQLSCAIGMGEEFWGRKTLQGPVVIVDLELADGTWYDRLALWKGYRTAMGQDVQVRSVYRLGLRHVMSDLDHLADKIIERVRELKPRLVILDPVYRIFGNRNENAAGDVARFLNYALQITTKTGAAVMLIHHFAKGDPNLKTAIDRFVGSGAFGRFADTLIALTPQEEFALDRSMTVNLVLRSFPAKCEDPFVIAHALEEHPFFEVSESKDPSKLRQQGHPTYYSDEALLSCLADGPLNRTAWGRRANSTIGIGERQFLKRSEDLIVDGLVIQKGKLFHLTALNKNQPGHKKTASNDCTG